MIPPLLAVFSWPLAGLILFKKLPVQLAVIWIILAGYMFLPEKAGINLPVLPGIGKGTMPSFLAAIMVMVASHSYFSHRNRPAPPPERVILPGWLPGHTLAKILFFGLLFGEVMTVLTNGDRLVYGSRTLPGLRTYDAGSRVMGTAVALLPMLVARKCLATPEQHKQLILAMVIAGVIYSLPTLWEARMSPQLNLHVYGKRVASWVQHVRNDGYRPAVFMHHGLWLAIFMAMTSLAAVAYIRLAAPRYRFRAIIVALWLMATLSLMNSLGALLILIVLVGPLFFLTSRLQMLIAAGLVGVVLVYPMMRGVGLIPVERAISIATSIDAQRAQSLAFRLRNEDLLLEKAERRPLFGWGSWGRNQVYDDQGRDISVTDGRWVIEIGSNGWLGYLTRFGLLCVPILLLTIRGGRYPPHAATAALAMMLTANLLDLIPNATLTPITWLLAGALIGRLEYNAGLASDASEAEAAASGKTDPTRKRPGRAGSRPPSPDPVMARQSGYTRQKTFHKRQTKGRHG